MATASIAWTYTPLTLPRLCRNELAALRMEIQRSEKVDKLTATRQAIHMIRELETYRDDWDRMAYLAGNRAGMPF